MYRVISSKIAKKEKGDSLYSLSSSKLILDLENLTSSFKIILITSIKNFCVSIIVGTRPGRSN